MDRAPGPILGPACVPRRQRPRPRRRRAPVHAIPALRHRPLTKIHGQVVSGRACAEIAIELGVPEMLGGRLPERDFEGGLSPRRAGRQRAGDGVDRRVADRRLSTCSSGSSGPQRACSPPSSPRSSLAVEHAARLQVGAAGALARAGRRVLYEVAEESGPPHDKTLPRQARVGDEVARDRDRCRARRPPSRPPRPRRSGNPAVERRLLGVARDPVRSRSARYVPRRAGEHASEVDNPEGLQVLPRAHPPGVLSRASA